MDLSGLSRANMEPSLRMAPSPWTQQPRNHLWLVFHPHPPYLNGYLLSLSQMHPAFFVSTISTVLVQGIMAISHQDKCNHVLTALALPPTPPPLSTLQPEWSRDNANLRGTPSHYILQWLFNSFGLKIKKKKILKWSTRLCMVWLSLALQLHLQPCSPLFPPHTFAYAAPSAWKFPDSSRFLPSSFI